MFEGQGHWLCYSGVIQNNTTYCLVPLLGFRRAGVLLLLLQHGVMSLRRCGVKVWKRMPSTLNPAP